MLDDVGIRVRRDERAFRPDEPREKRALVPVLRDGRDAAEQQRMVGDEEVGTRVDRLVDGAPHGVDGEQHTFDRGIRIAGDEAGCVPRLGALERPESIDRRHDLGENGWHAPSLAPHADGRAGGRAPLVGPAGLEPTTSTV